MPRLDGERRRRTSGDAADHLETKIRDRDGQSSGQLRQGEHCANSPRCSQPFQPLCRTIARARRQPVHSARYRSAGAADRYRGPWPRHSPAPRRKPILQRRPTTCRPRLPRHANSEANIQKPFRDTLESNRSRLDAWKRPSSRRSSRGTHADTERPPGRTGRLIRRGHDATP